MARTPLRLLIEKGIEAGADYIPDVIETPLRRAFSIDVPKSKVSKPKASLAVTPKAKPKQLALPAPPKQLALPAPGPGLPPFAVKPRGGQWWANKDFGYSNTSPEAAAQSGASPLALEKWVPEDEGVLGYVDRQVSPAQQWLEKALTKYYKNDFGTAEDPLRDLAARGLHYDPEMTPETWQKTVNDYLIEDRIGDITLPKDLYSDDVYPGVGDEFTTEARMAMPWLSKLPVTDKLYGISGGGLDLGHFTDEFLNALGDPGASGLPMDFAIRPESLGRMTFPQAVEHVGKINQFRAKEMERAALSNLDSPAVQTFKEYADDNPMGLRWTELKAPEPTDDLLDDMDRGLIEMATKDGRKVNPAHMDEVRASRSRKALEDALKYEGDTMGHCVGGYCPDVMEGRSRIFSLRDAKGEPHVTIETAPVLTGISGDILNQMEPGIWDKIVSEGGHYDTFDWLKNNRPDLLARFDDRPTEEIIQIKGKQNRAPKDDYLPFVQDFVKSGQWGNVGDLGNTGLVKLPDGRYITQQQAEEVLSGVHPSYRISPNDISRIGQGDSWWSEVAPRFEGYAVGGRVSADRCFSKGKSAVYAVNKSRK